MYAQYTSHDDATFSYMEDALRHVDTMKVVFLLERDGIIPKAIANALRRELVKKQKVDKETTAISWTQSEKWREMNAVRDDISHRIDVSQELDATFNFPKIHLMSHCVKHIWWYGALQQYCAERHDQAHKMNLKDCWNTSKPNLNYLPQVITFPRRILCFEISELNHEAIAQHGEIRGAACKVLPSGVDQAAPMSSRS